MKEEEEGREGGEGKEGDGGERRKVKEGRGRGGE